jgi:hypothetical protein
MSPFLDIMVAIVIFLSPPDIKRIEIWPYAADPNNRNRELMMPYLKGSGGWCVDFGETNRVRCIHMNAGIMVDEKGKVLLNIKDNLKMSNGTNYVFKPIDFDNPLGFSIVEGKDERTIQIKEKGKIVRELRVRTWKSTSGQPVRAETNRLSSAAAMTGHAGSGYDKPRYDKMQRVIDGSTNKLLGISLADAAKLLSLDNAKWDDGYTSRPHSQLRVYHFRGFYLLLDLQDFPSDASPDHAQAFSSDSERSSNRGWWVANFYPSLHIDGLNDSKKRMTNYWDRVHSGFRQRTDEMKSQNSEPNQ